MSKKTDINLLSALTRKIIQISIIVSGALILVFIELSFLMPIESQYSQSITVGLVILSALFIGTTLLLFLDKRTSLEKLLRNSEEKYRTLTENSLTGIFILQDNLIAYVNRELCNITGLKKEELVGRSPNTLICEEDLDFFIFRESSRIGGGAQPSNYEIRIKANNNNLIWCENVAKLVNFEEKTSVLANLIDITEKKKRQARLATIHKVSESLLASKPIVEIYQICLDSIMKLLQADSGAIYTIENNRLRLAESRGFPKGLKNITLEIDECLIGLAASEKACYKISDSNTYEGLLPFAGIVNEFNSFVVVPFVFEDKALGASVILSKTIDFFTDEDVAVIESISDQMGSAITRELLLHKLEHQARHDPLTGLFNRRYFNEQVHQIVDTRRKHNNKVTFLMIDIDRFKEINDTYGHLKGDQVLKEVAKILINSAGEEDIVVRFGGDEFLMVLSDSLESSKTLDEIAALMKTLNQQMEEIDFYLDLSIGTAIWEKSMVKNIEDIIREVDEKMYMVKKGKT